MIIDMTVSAMSQKLNEQKQWDWETARLKMIYGYTVSDSSIGFTYSSSDESGLEYNFSGFDAPVESLDQSTIEWWTI